MAVEIYCTQTDSGRVSAIAKTGAADLELIRHIEVGRAPRGGVKFTADGRGYVSNFGEDSISEIDLRAHQETGRIPVGRAPRGIGIVPGDRFALVSSSGSESVSVVDLTERREVGRIAVGSDPRHMAITPDGLVAYVAVWGARYVSKVDLSPLVGDSGGEGVTAVREVKRLGEGQLGQPYSVALDPGGRCGYVTHGGTPYVSVIDLRTDEMREWIHVGGSGGRSVAFTADGRFAFASVENRSELAVIDLDSNQVMRRIPVGACPRGVAADPHDLTVYCSGFSRTARHLGGDVGITPKALMAVHLGSAEDVERGTDPQYSEIPIGAGPSGVSVVELDAPVSQGPAARGIWPASRS